MTKNKPILFIFSLTLPFAAAAVGSAFTVPAVSTWYAALNKPAFSPPNWVFGPVWITLYLLMGISLLMLLSKKPNKKTKKMRTYALYYFFIQLAFNALWSVVFFGLRSALGGMVTIIVLWLWIFQTIRYFDKLSRHAALLLVPYILWVSFAAVLNFFILYLNW